MQGIFASIARLYRQVVHLAAQVFAPKSTESSQPVQRASSVAKRRAAAKRIPLPSQPAPTQSAALQVQPPKPHVSPAAPPPNDALNPKLARLIRELRATDGMTRPKVAKRIQDQFGSAAVPALIPLVSDGEWIMRYWAARLLKDMADPSALPALQRQLSLEDDKTTKTQITEAILSLRPFKVSSASSANELATLPVAMQGRLGELRRDLIQAYRGHDTARAEGIRQKLVKMQVDLCERLRRKSLSPQERARLVSYYRNASARDRLLRKGANDYHNNCWVCRADIDSSANRQCRCNWYI